MIPESRDEVAALATSFNHMAESLQRRQAEVLQGKEEIQRNLERIRALHEIDLAITSSLNLRTVLDVLLEKIEPFFPYPSAATIRLVGQKTGQLEPVACRNLDEQEWKSGEWKGGRGPANVVFDTKAPMMVRNIQTDQRIRDAEFFRKHGLVSYLGVPLIAKGEMLGVLSFYTKEEREFNNEEVEFISTLGGQAAIAIYNAQLYEEMARASRVKDEFLSVMSHELSYNSKVNWSASQLRCCSPSTTVTTRDRPQTSLFKPWWRPMGIELEMYGRRKNGDKFPEDHVRRDGGGREKHRHCCLTRHD